MSTVFNMAIDNPKGITSQIGEVEMGKWPGGTGGFIGHTDLLQSNTGNYALQFTTTNTFLNTPSGGTLSLRHNNTNLLTLTSTTNTFSNKTVFPGNTVVASDGKLGVNRSTPSYLFHLRGTGTTSATRNFVVENGNGATIMDFRDDTYAFFGCGQTGGSASGFIFRYSDTNGPHFVGYNYGNGSGAYKPLFLGIDVSPRDKGVYINMTPASAPTANTEFAVAARGDTSSSFIAKFYNDSMVEKFIFFADGQFTLGSSGSAGGTIHGDLSIQSGGVTTNNNSTFNGNLDMQNNNIDQVGTLTATTINGITKNFDIQHPSDPNMRLKHGCLEGPEYGVYVRGTVESSNEITLPGYWSDLVDTTTITVQVTPRGSWQQLFVSQVGLNGIIIGSPDTTPNAMHFDYIVHAERKDCGKIVVEYTP